MPTVPTVAVEAPSFARAMSASTFARFEWTYRAGTTVDASMTSVVETRGHIAVGQRDSERLPRVGK
jgi:hypothetical protein